MGRASGRGLTGAQGIEMIGVRESKDVYVSGFSSLENGLSESGWSWSLPLRRAAIRSFAERGFPTTKLEEWKHTNVAPIATVQFQPAAPGKNGLTADHLAVSSLADLAFAEEAFRLVFVNGYYASELSSATLPQKVRVSSLRETALSDGLALQAHLGRYADYEANAFVALNTAFMTDGAFIEVAKGVVVDWPIHLLFVSTMTDRPTVSYPRILIKMGSESQLSLVEMHIGVGGRSYLTNAVTEVVMGENAVLDYYKVQRENSDAFHVGSVQVLQSRDSSFRSHSVSLGGALVRNDLYVALEGEGANCSLNGLYLVNGREHVDNHTVIDHVKPHGTSREIYKGILDGKATAVFNGSVIVRKDAQKTDAIQANKNLMLSENAVINSKPQLEINADDVKCSHGTTIGQINPEAMFYLRSRGIAFEDARRVLTYAFANDILNRMKVEALRVRLEDLLLKGLSGKEEL